ncbi:MAG: hypothetical protein HC819_21170 [Cyclobacteriaceae bacterium]|nr:hypothetical protein [Cyclobacteriaceae bacterium]
MFRFTTILLSFFLAHLAKAQDVESFFNSKPFEVGGGSINLANVYYSSFDSPSSREGFSLYASGNVNFSIFGQSAPLSFSYTNRKLNYTQPFNNFSFAPRYKWIATRFGSHSVNYSPYTMAGHRLSGASVALTPGHWKIDLAYGRLKKAVVPDSLGNQQHSATFGRMGMAGGLEYSWDKDRVYGTFSMDKDEVSSLPKNFHSDENTPKQNAAFSLGFVKHLMKKFTLDGEVAYSLLHRDISNTTQLELSKQQFFVYKTNLNYTGNGYGLSIGMEHVDPGYETLGGYFFNNDLQKYLLGGLTTLVNGRLNIDVQAGLEKNNLQNSETNTTSRWVGALNSTFQISKRLNVSGTYSNFTAFTNVRPTTDYEYMDEVDTLNYRQVNQSCGVSATYQMGSQQLPQQLAFNTALQVSGFSGHGSEQNPGSTFLSNTLSYGLNIPDKSLNFAASVSSYTQEYGHGSSKSIGPTLSLGKAVMNKQLKSTLALSYNRARQEEKPASQIYSARWNISFQSSHKKEKTDQWRNNDREKARAEKRQLTADKGYYKEASALTGIDLPEDLSIRKEKTRTVKGETVKTVTDNEKKRYLTERHQFNLSAVFTHRDTPGASTTTFSELTIRMTYAYSF